MPVQNNTNDCGVFVLIFLYHLLLMDGVNNFELLDDPLCALKKHKQIYCDSSNMRNLREFITKNILQKCTITQVPQLMLEKGE
jgi:Ulp1 family protease